MLKRPEPFWLSHGQRELIVAAIMHHRETWEAARAAATDRHGRWAAGLKVRQCHAIIRLLQSSRADREARADAKARRGGAAGEPPTQPS